MAVDIYVNGLAVTPVRVKLLVAIRDDGGRIYHEAGAVRDDKTGGKVTARVKEMVGVEWVRAKTPQDPPLAGEWSQTRVYYRLTDLGRAAIERGRR